MKKIWKISAALCAMIIGSMQTAQAGEDDFGIWTELGATKILPRGWSLSLEGEFRTMDNSKRVDKWQGTFSIGYKPFKYLKLEAGYAFMYEYSKGKRKEHYKDDVMDPRYWNGYNITSNYWSPSNRAFASATGEIKLFNVVKVSLRERYQYTNTKEQWVPRTKYRFQPDQTTLKKSYADPNLKERKQQQYLRSRLKIELDKKNWALEPFVAFELFNDLDDELALDKTRFSLGSSYKLNTRNSVSLAYIFNNEVDEDPYEGRHAISVGYQLKF